MRVAGAALLLLGVCGIAGCRSAGGGVGTRKFSSRNEIVPAVDLMLRDKAWATLAQYYDLEHSEIPPKQLVRGEFFYDASPDAAPSDEEFRRYRHPFAPGARLDHEMDAPDPDVVVLVMVFDLPGTSASHKHIVYRFRVKRHGWGWQILPPSARVRP